MLERLYRSLNRHSSGSGLWSGLMAVGLLLTFSSGYLFTGQPINLLINGQPRQLRVRQLQVEAIIRELELALAPEDSIRPGLDTTLRPGESLAIQLARPIAVEADGRRWQLLSHHQTVAELLAEIGLRINPHDELFINDQKSSLEAALPTAQTPPPADAAGRLFAAAPRAAILTNRPELVRLTLYRAVPITLHDGQSQNRFYTARQSIGETLADQGITLFEADEVRPALDRPLSPEMHIYIRRSMPITIVADNLVIQTRTHQKTTGRLLAEAGIALMGQDYTRPPLDQPISANDTVEVVRVREILRIETEFIPFETEWIPDETMELDQQQVYQPGVTGLIKTRSRIRYENEQELWREVEDEWLDRPASKRVVAYGTRIVVRTLNTETGPIRYWRKIPMLATSYTAATSGKPLDHPHYGITRSGLTAGYGIVAVDPKVLPLMTELYIPGYGNAVAGDTGGMVLGKHIDLGYNDGVPVPAIYGWRDVYVLTPIPPANRVRYVLPRWPER